MRDQITDCTLLGLLLLCVGLTIGHLGCGGGSATTPPPPPPITVTVSPTLASMPASGTQQFAATVTGTSNTAVTWSLSGCTAADCGTISPAALYAAPSVIITQATVTVTATSQADPTKFATATVNDMPIKVSIAPASAWVAPGATLQFTTSVLYDPKNAGVVWALPAGCSADTCGALSNVTVSSVTYTAPAAVPNPPTVTLTVTSITDPSKVAQVTITVSGQMLTTLYNLGSQPNDGANPYAGLIQATDGNFYGTTSKGGAHDNGTVFRITTGGALTTLHNFNLTDGAGPLAGLIQANDGNFYGTTCLGGAVDKGAVFTITTGGTLTTLYSFNTDWTGAYPAGGLVQATDGNFYGTTTTKLSGCEFGCGGTVFKITPAGSLTLLYTFPGLESADTTAALIQATDENFYGTTYYTGSGCGGSGCGTVYKITPEGTLTTLYSFNGPDGSHPYAGLIEATDGNFYGTTEQGGGSGCSGSGCGTVFKITPGGTLTTLHSFSGADGSQPDGGLIQAADGNFYGTTHSGGTSNNGTAFKITSAGTLTTIYSFSGADGSQPYAGLIQASDGNLYGTTYAGGTNNKGTVFVVMRPD